MLAAGLARSASSTARPPQKARRIPYDDVHGYAAAETGRGASVENPKQCDETKQPQRADQWERDDEHV
jgi:hypothetical protein